MAIPIEPNSKQVTGRRAGAGKREITLTGSARLLVGMAVLLSPAHGQRDLKLEIEGRRRALVIGNNAYTMGKLVNADNDALLMSATLRALDFQVDTATDLSLRQMEDSVNRFAESLSKGDVVGDAHLLEDVVQMVFDRLLADEHLLSYLLVLVSPGRQTPRSPFPGGERAAFTAFASLGPAAAFQTNGSSLARAAKSRIAGRRCCREAKLCSSRAPRSPGVMRTPASRSFR